MNPLTRKPPRSGRGRPKGSPNKTSALLKDAILEAGRLEGGKEGLTGYLRKLAKDQPTVFASLLGRVLPLQVGGDPENPMEQRISVSWMK